MTELEISQFKEHLETLRLYSHEVQTKVINTTEKIRTAKLRAKQDALENLRVTVINKLNDVVEKSADKVAENVEDANTVMGDVLQEQLNDIQEQLSAAISQKEQGIKEVGELTDEGKANLEALNTSFEEACSEIESNLLTRQSELEGEIDKVRNAISESCRQPIQALKQQLESFFDQTQDKLITDKNATRERLQKHIRVQLYPMIEAMVDQICNVIDQLIKQLQATVSSNDEGAAEQQAVNRQFEELKENLTNAFEGFKNIADSVGVHI